jgi:hypothetical protein
VTAAETDGLDMNELGRDKGRCKCPDMLYILIDRFIVRLRFWHVCVLRWPWLAEPALIMYIGERSWVSRQELRGKERHKLGAVCKIMYDHGKMARYIHIAPC